MKKDNRHVNDHDLTLDQYLHKYNNLLDMPYKNKEVINYLTKRWEYINNKAEWKDVQQAFNKTNFPKAIAARNEQAL